MTNYTAWQWLLIDAANQADLDKLLFEERIQWATDHLHELEDMMVPHKTRPLYRKAVMAIRKAQASIPTGHLVAVDAICSGIQIMSCLTGCITGATNTGLVDPDVRSDAYTTVTAHMNQILPAQIQVPRADAKDATLTSFYGSKKTPKDIFGEDTPELSAFYIGAQKTAPGAWELLQDLLASWQPMALVHEWKLPDGFDARVKVMEKKSARITVDELDKASFTYEYYENKGSETGLSNAANVVHSVDAYVLREMHRRCNYDQLVIGTALANIEFEQKCRTTVQETPGFPIHPQVAYYKEQYERSTLASSVILPHLKDNQTIFLSDEHLEALRIVCEDILSHRSFELVTVHDAFASHANNVNQVRWHYKEILAEIAESDLIDDLLSQLHGEPITFTRQPNNLGTLIRGSNYALT